MENKNKRWSKEEDIVLLDCIKENPNNLSKAFIEAGIKLNRASKSCKNRWYIKLSKESKVCFVTVGKKTKNINRKIVSINTSDNTELIRPTIWERIKKILNIN